jgi:hypothetical protein
MRGGWGRRVGAGSMSIRAMNRLALSLTMKAVGFIYSCGYVGNRYLNRTFLDLRNNVGLDFSHFKPFHNCELAFAMDIQSSLLDQR